MKKTKILVILTTILFISSMAAAAPRIDAQQVKNEARNVNGEITDGQNNNPLSFLSALSFLTGPTEVSPGATAEFSTGLDVTESFKDNNARAIWTFYDCGDTDCQNPPQEDINNDGRVDSCQLEDDVKAGKDDCIDAVSYSVDRPTREGYIKGESLTLSLDYQVPTTETLYISEAYVYKDGIVTDTPKHKFQVVDTSTGTDGDSGTDGSVDDGVQDSDQDGIIDSSDACPETQGSVNNNGCPANSSGLPVTVLLVVGVGVLLVVGGAVTRWA